VGGGGQNGGNVEMVHEQGQGMDVLSSTLDYNSSSVLADVGYQPNPNVCFIMQALLLHSANLSDQPRCNRCIKKRVDCTGGRPGRRCERCRNDKKGCKFLGERYLS
jgi:hypothetical protein